MYILLLAEWRLANPLETTNQIRYRYYCISFIVKYKPCRKHFVFLFILPLAVIVCCCSFFLYGYVVYGCCGLSLNCALRLYKISHALHLLQPVASLLMFACTCYICMLNLLYSSYTDNLLYNWFLAKLYSNLYIIYNMTPLTIRNRNSHSNRHKNKRKSSPLDGNRGGAKIDKVMEGVYKREGRCM